MTFLVRKPPNAGKLSEPKNDAPDAAIVRYFPPTDLKVKSASFTYAVKSSEGVSAPAEVTIEIVDAPAQLRVPEKLAFAPLLLGERKVETIEIGNPGGEPGEGEARIGDPFAIDGEAHYHIEPNGKAFMRIVFAPTAAGTFETEIVFSSHPTAHTTVTGSAQAPIEVNPGTLTLHVEPLTGVRSGFASIQNHTDRKQRIEAQATDRLKIVEPIELEPGAKTVFSISTAKDDTAAIAETVHFIGINAEASLEVVAEAVPADIRISRPEMTLRPDAKRSIWTGFLELSNRGGKPGTIQIAQEGGLVPEERELTILPGETKRVNVSLRKMKQAEFHGALKVTTPTGAQTAKVSAVFASPATSRAFDHSKSRVAENDDPESRGGDPKFALADFDPVSIAPGFHTRLVEISATTATLEWPALKSPIEYRAEIRQLALRNGNLETSWSVHPEFEAVVTNGQVQGKLHALEPGRVYTVQVLIASGENAGEVAARATFQTGPAPPRWAWLTWPRVLMTLAAVLLGGVIWQRRRQRTLRL